MRRGLIASAAIVSISSVVTSSADTTLDLVDIPAGPFTMGADKARDPMAFDNERWSPAQGEGTVDVPAFLIARREVTVAEFTQFAQSGKWSIDPRALAGPADHPVAYVSWTDALAFYDKCSGAKPAHRLIALTKPEP